MREKKSRVVVVVESNKKNWNSELQLKSVQLVHWLFQRKINTDLKNTQKTIQRKQTFKACSNQHLKWGEF